MVYGKLVVVGFAGRRQRKSIMLACQCACGMFVDVVPYKLTGGNTTSCGCAHREFMKEHNEALVTHGHARGGTITPEYRAWTSMIRRCTDPRSDVYPDYGGRGITVCERWMSFPDFFADMGKKPSRLYSLERRDNNAGYDRENVFWGTAKEQARNQRRTKKYELDGEVRPLGEWADQFGIARPLVLSRITSGWTLREALTLPVGSRRRGSSKSARSRLHGVWYAIRHRCEDPSHSRYSDYGGRGIRMCEEWMASFDAFFAYLGPRPSVEHTVDRIDNAHGYEPGNVRWATYETQSRNRRMVKQYELDGISMILPEWADIAGLELSIVSSRLSGGWTLSQALGTPLGGAGRTALKDRRDWEWPRK